MEVRMYRDARHPDMLLEIRMQLEDRGMDIRLTEMVADLVNAGWLMASAIGALQGMQPTKL